jgi:hypothetical protein
VSEQTNTDRLRRLRVEWTISFLLLLVLLFAAPRVARSIPNEAMRVAVSMSPMLLYLWMIVRQIRRSDEFVRKITLEHIAIAAAVTVGFGLMYAILEKEGYPKLSAMWVLPMMTGVWGVLRIVELVRNR